MDPNTQELVMGAAGASGESKVYVEDVFSTYLYTGNGSTQTITNGIDLSGKGGLVWMKSRTVAQNNWLFDTARSTQFGLVSNLTNAEINQGTGFLSFNSNGFSLSGQTGFNSSSENIVSWTFRKAAKFFDVVTYTGNGANRTISHNLGSVPGCIIVKRTDTTADWQVYHRSLANTEYMVLNSDAAKATGTTRWNSTTPTSTEFSLGTDTTVNANGGTYVAYLFAHDAGGFGDSGNDNVISCGTFTGGSFVNLGWEPQWVLMKTTTISDAWWLFDAMRGTPVNGNDVGLVPSANNAEISSANFIEPASTGFTPGAYWSTFPGIYIAIRRGPMKTPTDATKVFYAELDPQSEIRETLNVPFPPDLVNTFSRNGTDRTSTYNFFQFCDRLRGLGTPNNTFAGGATDAPVLISSSTGAENDPAFNTSFIQLKADGQNITGGTGWNSTLYGNYLNYFFRRAPGFFDVVAYTGTGSARTVSHNLGVLPELAIIKSRSVGPTNWPVAYFSGALRGNLNGVGGFSSITSSDVLFPSSPGNTSTTLALGSNASVNGSSATYIAYLFATSPGVSKVGSYTGTGTTLQVNCGFTNGARFVLIKRTDTTGDWYVWDTARGIVSANDPYLLLNSTAAEVTNTDYIDPLSSGFEISSTAPAAINANGGSYIFLAIA